MECDANVTPNPKYNTYEGDLQDSVKAYLPPHIQYTSAKDGTMFLIYCWMCVQVVVVYAHLVQNIHFTGGIIIIFPETTK